MEHLGYIRATKNITYEILHPFKFWATTRPYDG